MISSKWVEAAYYFELFLQKSDSNRALRSVVSQLGQAYEKMGEAELAMSVYRRFISTAEPEDSRMESAAISLEEFHQRQEDAIGYKQLFFQL